MVARTVTTTLKLTTALKHRIAPLAREAGKSPHAWMVEALETQAELAELRRAFIREAAVSAAATDAGAPLFAAEEVHSYLRSRVRGVASPRPKPTARARSSRR